MYNSNTPEETMLFSELFFWLFCNRLDKLATVHDADNARSLLHALEIAMDSIDKQFPCV